MPSSRSYYLERATILVPSAGPVTLTIYRNRSTAPGASHAWHQSETNVCYLSVFLLSLGTWSHSWVTLRDLLERFSNQNAGNNPQRQKAATQAWKLNCSWLHANWWLHQYAQCFMHVIALVCFFPCWVCSLAPLHQCAEVAGMHCTSPVKSSTTGVPNMQAEVRLMKVLIPKRMFLAVFFLGVFKREIITHVACLLWILWSKNHFWWAIHCKCLYGFVLYFLRLRQIRYWTRLRKYS